MLSAQFTARGYRVYEASTGAEVLQAVSDLDPDVILLDLGLPDIDGIGVIQRVRDQVQTPIVVLSVRAAASDKIAALEAGADDYLTKPCQTEDLLERIRAVRFQVEPNDIFVAGDLLIDLQRQLVQVGGRPVPLTQNEYKVLRMLSLHAGKLVTQHRLAQEVGGMEPDDSALQLLRVTFANLRSKLEVDPARPRHIATEPGVGYRLRTES